MPSFKGEEREGDACLPALGRKGCSSLASLATGTTSIIRQSRVARCPSHVHLCFALFERSPHIIITATTHRPALDSLARLPRTWITHSARRTTPNVVLGSRIREDLHHRFLSLYPFGFPITLYDSVPYLPIVTKTSANCCRIVSRSTALSGAETGPRRSQGSRNNAIAG